MVKVALIVISLFLSHYLHAASLIVNLRTTDVEIGKYLPVKIIYKGDYNPGLASLKLWEKHFFIERGETELEKFKTGELIKIEHLRLYPRQTGQLNLAGIALGGTFTKSQTIIVKKAIRRGIDLSPYWKNQPRKVWLGQRFEASVTVNLLQNSNHIYVEDEPIEGFNTEYVTKNRVLENGITTVTISWYLTAQSIGNHTITLPTIEQRGKGRWVYHLSQAVLKVVPIPSYIPPTIAIGKASLGLKLTNVNGVQIWVVTVKNKGQLTAEVFGLRSQLARVAGTTVDSVNVSKTEIIESTGITKQSYHVVTPIWSFGLLSSQKISLSYFDIETGQIINTIYQLPSIWKAPIWVLIMCLILVLLVSKLFFQLVKPTIIRLKLKRELLNKIQLCQTVDELRLLLSDSKSLLEDNKIMQVLNKVCFSKDGEMNVDVYKIEALNKIKLFNFKKKSS